MIKLSQILSDGLGRVFFWNSTCSIRLSYLRAECFYVSPTCVRYPIGWYNPHVTCQALSVDGEYISRYDSILSVSRLTSVYFLFIGTRWYEQSKRKVRSCIWYTVQSDGEHYGSSCWDVENRQETQGCWIWKVSRNSQKINTIAWNPVWRCAWFWFSFPQGGAMIVPLCVRRKMIAAGNWMCGCFLVLQVKIWC